MHDWQGKLDLLNIVLIGLAKELPEQDERYELHRLLCALLSQKLSKEEKFKIVESEYKIPLDSDIGEDVDTMCNLSQGIKEEAIEIGKKDGIKIAEISFITSMYMNGYPLNEIAKVAKKSVAEVKEVIDNEQIELV